MSKGEEMYSWAIDLFKVNRSITGEGVRETLKYFKLLINELNIKSFPSGKKVLDWIVPDEWNVVDAYIADLEGNKLVNFKENNLHLVGYSEPIKEIVKREELLRHIHTLKHMPTAIPYVTSYYKKNWGFCIEESKKILFDKEYYKVVINSSFKKGEMNYGEIYLSGDSHNEVLLNSYICHPSMANNELSGPVVLIALAQWIKSLPKKRNSYRILLCPETIGAIAYIDENRDCLMARVKHAFNVTCVGDPGNFSFMPSRYGNTQTDRLAKFILEKFVGNYKEYSFLERGSDERQYCSPGIDLPMISIMRSKYGEYKEYHTSLDNLDFIDQKSLEESLEVYKKCILLIEKNIKYIAIFHCEPNLGKRGLYPTISNEFGREYSKKILNILTYLDGRNDIIELVKITNINLFEVYQIIDLLLQHKLIKEIE